jgi:membrane-bound lytic murein transglycosylase B
MTVLLRGRRRVGAAIAAIAVVVGAGCSGSSKVLDAAPAPDGAPSTTTAVPSPTAPAATAAPSGSTVPTAPTTPTTTTAGPPAGAAGAAAPNGRRAPRAASDPAGLARQIETTERALRDPATPAAQLPDLGHLNQVAYRRLSYQPDWQATVLAALPADLRPIAQANVDARNELLAMRKAPPENVPVWEIVSPEPADKLLSHYREAQAATGVPWQYLAAINLVESGLGRVRGLSVAGARGPMQFLPSTWAERGIGAGDIDDPHDAIRAAARYLVRRGAPGDMVKALRGYNNHANYGRAVTAYARLLEQDEHAFNVFYNWEIYYLSASGDLWLPVGYRNTEPKPVTDYLATAPWSAPPPGVPIPPWNG